MGCTHEGTWWAQLIVLNNYLTRQKSIKPNEQHFSQKVLTNIFQDSCAPLETTHEHTYLWGILISIILHKKCPWVLLYRTHEDSRGLTVPLEETHEHTCEEWRLMRKTENSWAEIPRENCSWGFQNPHEPSWGLMSSSWELMRTHELLMSNSWGKNSSWLFFVRVSWTACCLFFSCLISARLS